MGLDILLDLKWMYRHCRHDSASGGTIGGTGIRWEQVAFGQLVFHVI
jgi:hypothetical protein